MDNGERYRLAFFCPFFLMVAIAFSAPVLAANKCIRANFAIGHGVKHKASGISDFALGGVTYEQRRDTGAIRVLKSTVGFISGTKTKVVTKGQGTAADFSVEGNITRVPKSVVVVGDLPLQGVPGRGDVSGHLEIAARGIKKIGVKSGSDGRLQNSIQGKTSYILTDANTGEILSSGSPGAFSKLRQFAYRWRTVTCGNGGVKR